MDIKLTNEKNVFALDLNFLTIHGKCRYPGLYIWLKDGRKMLVKVPDGCLLVQVSHTCNTSGIVFVSFVSVSSIGRQTDRISHRWIRSCRFSRSCCYKWNAENNRTTFGEPRIIVACFVHIIRSYCIGLRVGAVRSIRYGENKGNLSCHTDWWPGTTRTKPYTAGHGLHTQSLISSITAPFLTLLWTIHLVSPL